MLDMIQIRIQVNVEDQHHNQVVYKEIKMDYVKNVLLEVILMIKMNAQLLMIFVLNLTMIEKFVLVVIADTAY